MATSSHEELSMSAAFHIGSATVEPIETNWRDRLPVLKGRAFTLRELTVEDAPALFTMLSVDEVARFISPPPTTIEGYEQFIRWTHARRMALVMRLLAHAELDALISGESRFEELPRVLAQLATAPGYTLTHRIVYRE